jgi:dTDP-4-dehydrorhamnose reductase
MANASVSNRFTFMVLGSTGMLGQALVNELHKRNKRVVGIAPMNAEISIDITDHAQLINAIETLKPDVIINTVAIVNLASCQQHAKQSYLVNAKPSWILSNYCSANNVKYVYISTDHFFSGDKDLRHSEEADIILRNVYAMTKYMGEEYTLLDENALVVRTNIVGFRHNQAKPTFVEWIIQAINSGEAITLFDDYYTSSIDVKSFSQALCDLISQNAKGLINLASRQVVSKKMFIQALADKLQLPLKNVTSGSVTDIADGIERNESLGLDVSLAEKLLGYFLPTLAEVINNLAIEYTNKETAR